MGFVPWHKNSGITCAGLKVEQCDDKEVKSSCCQTCGLLEWDEEVHNDLYYKQFEVKSHSVVAEEGDTIYGECIAAKSTTWEGGCQPGFMSNFVLNVEKFVDANSGDDMAICEGQIKEMKESLDIG